MTWKHKSGNSPGIILHLSGCLPPELSSSPSVHPSMCLLMLRFSSVGPCQWSSKGHINSCHLTFHPLSNACAFSAYTHLQAPPLVAPHRHVLTGVSCRRSAASSVCFSASSGWLQVYWLVDAPAASEDTHTHTLAPLSPGWHRSLFNKLILDQRLN